MKQTNVKSMVSMSLAMLIYGTIGIFRNFLPSISSAMLALDRAVIGALFLLVVILVRRNIDFNISAANFIKLAVSGAMLGFNWMLLFEAYKYTSVGVATLCYYMAPTIITLASPVFLGERLSKKKVICIFVASAGMFLVSGATGEGAGVAGIILGLMAAVLYAAIVIMNKKTADVGAYEKTFIQLAVSAVVMAVYVAFSEGISFSAVHSGDIALLLVVGVVHTGIAYTLYFGSIGRLKVQTAAVISYIDPISAIILSAVVLGEPLALAGVAGSVLILGSSVAGELDSLKEVKDEHVS